jgi:endoglucanase
MRSESVALLKKMVETPSPSGFEEPVQRIVRAEMKGLCDEVTTDVHGNVIGAIHAKGRPRVMLAGHCDEIGMMVTHVDKEGYVYFASIGGVDTTILPALRLVVHGGDGPVLGVVGRKPIHLMTPEDRKPEIKIETLWLDIGAKDQEEALKRVAVGDPITFEPGFDVLPNELAASRGFDDKVGAFVVVETLRLLKRKRPKAAVFGVSTVQEELGLRGARTSAFSVDPDVGIAIDVGFASDYPGAEKKTVGESSLGKGPVLHRGANINPVVARRLAEAARRAKVPVQITAEPRATGTDANAIQISRAGVAAGLVSIPNRYMHTPVEMVSLVDLENAAKLLAQFIWDLPERVSFIPQ